jgi:hypothetical protein
VSFFRSPGEYSEAPFDLDFDIPVVDLSCMRSPGLNSDAPFVVLEVEFCISCPGDRLDAPGLSAAIALAPAASKIAAENTMVRFIANSSVVCLSHGNGKAAQLFRAAWNPKQTKKQLPGNTAIWSDAERRGFRLIR